MAWTAEAIETMRRLWPTHSASQIAVAIGAEHGIRMTRNAVIGKGLRSGMAAKRPPASPDGRVSTGRRKLQFNTNNISRLQVKVTGGDPGFKEPKHCADDQIPIKQRRTILTLTSFTCRWPVGHPRESSFFFCGAPVPFEHPYCPHHTQRSLSHAKDKQRSERRGFGQRQSA
jgi:GcrA cell cycle regulator